jgi:hypothetical protein
MQNIKKISIAIISLAIFLFASNVFAMTPSFSVSSDPNVNTIADLNITGDANSSIVLYYYSANVSGPQLKYIGNTNSSGTYSSGISLNDYNITQNSNIYVLVDGVQSNSIAWPYSSTVTSSNNLTFSQTSIATMVGQSTTITASNNGTASLYLSSNTNPQVANFSISGNQISVTGLSAGQTTANFCYITTNTSTTNCASVYVIVQNSGTSLLSFSQNNTSIISGQNVSINITGGNGFYQIQNNSSSTAISASLNGPVLTLYAVGTTGSSTITVCSTDMSSCGNVVASVGTYTTTGSGLSLSQNYPTVIMGQTQSITISGGSGNYYISSNSNTNIVQTYISGNTISIYGGAPGNSTIIVCAPSGECGTINAMVASASGGALSLSQTSLSLMTGQIISVTISGGTAPYSIIQSNDGKAQYSLSGSIVTVTGVSAGNSSTTICSAGGACVTLAVTVTGNVTNSAVSGVEPSFSQNNFSMNTNQTVAVYLSGNGGYYVSNNSNPNIISAAISANSVVIFGINVGSANVTVCQTGGQCNTIYLTVSNSTTATASSVPLTFDKSSVNMNVGDTTDINVTGGSGVGYYISYNSNSNAIGVYVNGGELIITGKAAGSGTLSVCSSSNVCASISVVVNQITQTTSSVSATIGDGYVFSVHLEYGMTSKAVTELQKRLTAKGVYTGPITGYYGSLTTTAVKLFQKENNLEQLGSVGPGTRAALNK